MDLTILAQSAKKASARLSAVSAEKKNSALKSIAQALQQNAAKIIEANKQDMDKAANENTPSALLKRLKFDENKINDVCSGIENLINLDDPTGKTLYTIQLDKGLDLYKVSCPIGLIGVIFESRPDVLVQISTLCLKSGNAVLLKGGIEAANTNQILYETIYDASIKAGLPENWIQLLQTRSDVEAMLGLDKCIDLLIPRGSNQFVRYIMDNTNIPVMGHADGICHVYVDNQADIDMAVKITVDAKTQYVAVCNAAETLLVHKDIAEKFLPAVKTALETKGVELRGCEKTRKIIDIKPAEEKDWSTEYLAEILSIKTVDSIDEAIDHINTYGSHHTDTIVTQSKTIAAEFMALVDSANVFLNVSTRFSDGYRYGLGAEVGISTNKIHARGPVGLEGLVIYKWKLLGSGQIVADYTGPDAKPFTHKKIKGEFHL
ncbi:MAG: glutamate-5-semialdehyde dehydrogenase [Planctomycetes bacterium]|nr:glutamate-5-semialdehyde dehydrogenase [Planctomycetota bacterium]MBU1518865.1 glutamate-5-semialdehyde dehydrogenase [Planctomycetota bacterium]MBU2457152.1 glutamate-5-semialdehyde dehydrogenase [Planctomycetota bacterium]MBU2596958.1 glutamate-5-semialdehyde dehydrogenase [Planctomycetota bacterium]